MVELKTVTVGDEREMLLEDTYVLDTKIPAGFTFDGASAPRLFWSLIPPFKGTKKAAILHDYQCSIAKNKEDRLVADRAFLAVLLVTSKISIARCLIGYLGVRIGALLGIGVHYE